MSKTLSWTMVVPMALVLFAACDEQPQQAPSPLPPEVKVMAVVQQDVPVYIQAIGETRGNVETEIRARVEGFLETVDFLEGSPVEKGQLLYTIDARPFEAALAQAEAGLAEAQAQQARAHQDVARYEPLVARNAVSREEYETAVAIERAAAAAVEASKAVVERCRIDLSYTRIAAPDDGLIGKTEVYPGTLVGRGQSTLLTRISRIDPIHVRLTVAERDYLELARRKLDREQQGDEPSSQAAFELILADGSVHPEPGRFVFADRSVDPRTGTIMMEVAFPNPQKIIRPGQYARVRAAIDMVQGAHLVPQRAVTELQGVYSVMVVGADGVVEQRLVQPAERVGSLWRIASGLTGTEKVIVEGLQKVRPGGKVNPLTVLPEAEQSSQSARPAAGGTQK